MELDAALRWFSAHPELLTALFVGSLGLFVASLLAVPLLVKRLPTDYFVGPKRPAWRPARGAGLLDLLRNLAGAGLILAGVAMLVLPGQGLLTILVGLLLMRFPGKTRLVRRLVRTAGVRQALDWMRRRAGQPPFQW